MAQQKTHQQITQEYLQNHYIVYLLERGLNLAIDHYISAPANFIADFLMKQKLDEDPYIVLMQIKQVGTNLLFVVDFLGTIRYFTFPCFDSKAPAQFPVQVYPELCDVDLLQQISVLYEKCGSHNIFGYLLDILRVLLRETRIEQFARLINQPRQQFAIPRLAVPVLEVAQRAVIGCIMRKDATAFVRLMVEKGVKGARFPFSIAYSDKTLDFYSDFALGFEQGDGEIQSYAQFLEALYLRQKTIQDTAHEVEKPEKKDTKTAKAAKLFSQKLSFAQQLLASFEALSRQLAVRDVCKIYVQLTKETLYELRFSDRYRYLEDLLLSIFMASRTDVILMLSGFVDLPKEAAECVLARSPSAKKQTIKGYPAPPAETAEHTFSYDFANAQADIRSAISHYNQLTSYDPEKQLKITIFSDSADVTDSIPFYLQYSHPICQQSEMYAFYEKLCQLSVQESKKDIVKFYVAPPGDKPPSYNDTKRAKAYKAEQLPQTAKIICSKSLAALLEEAEYYVVECESEMYEFLGEIEGLLCEKRGYFA